MYAIVKGYFEPYPEHIIEQCDTFHQASKRLWEMAENTKSNFTSSLIGSEYIYTFDNFYLKIEQVGKEIEEDN
jgi:hypothetical protein